MMRIHEYGLQDRENSRLYTKKPQCSGVGGNFVTVSLVDTRPAVLILVWGNILAIITFLFEFTFHRFVVKRNKFKVKKSKKIWYR